MKNKAIFLLHSFDELINHLTDEEAGQLLKALYDYDMRGIEREFEDRSMFFLFHQIKNTLDKHQKHYNDVCEARKKSAEKRWRDDSGETKNKAVMQMHANAYKEKENEKVKENLNEKENENVNVKENEKQDKAVGFEADRTQTHKSTYGEFKNILLTEEEYKRLTERFSDAASRIDSLSAYIKATGKVYADHYAQLINWHSYGSVPAAGDRRAEKKPPGERREPTFDVSAFTKKAVGIKYVAPEEG